MYDFVIKVCKKENIQITTNGIKLVIKRSNGDMRKLLNIIQSIYMYLNADSNTVLENKNNIVFDSDKIKDDNTIINEASVSKILSCPTHKHINSILEYVQANNLKKSYKFVNKIINEHGISLVELINYVYEYCIECITNEDDTIIKYPKEKVVEIIKNVCLINENLTYCNNDNIQLVSFLSVFYL
jgi:DNA polymerase III gamma/tau subunit